MTREEKIYKLRQIDWARGRLEEVRGNLENICPGHLSNTVLINTLLEHLNVQEKKLNETQTD